MLLFPAMIRLSFIAIKVVLALISSFALCILHILFQIYFDAYVDFVEKYLNYNIIYDILQSFIFSIIPAMVISLIMFCILAANKFSDGWLGVIIFTPVSILNFSLAINQKNRLLMLIYLFSGLVFTSVAIMLFCKWFYRQRTLVPSKQ